MTIDVHGHITSPKLFDRYPMPRSLLDIDGMIEQKARAGITMTIVGSPVGAGTMVPDSAVDNYVQPLDELEWFHDWIADQVRTRPGQLRAYVYTNPYGGDAMLKAAARRLSQDEFVGLVANSSVDGAYLDLPAADEFFALAAEHRAPVLLHPPARPAGGTRLRDLRIIEHVARPCEVAVGVAAILFAGWLDKYPQLRIVAPMGGGALPLLVEKLELAHRMPPRPGPPGVPGGREAPAATIRPPRDGLRQVYVDTASPSPMALLAAVRTLGPANVLFGTDTPPMTGSLELALGALSRLELTAEEEARIRRGNATELFGLTDDRVGPTGTWPGATEAAR